MRQLALIASALLALGLAGCDTATSPDETPLPHPGIAGLVAFYQFNGDLTDAGPDSLTAMSARDPVYIGDHNGAAESALYVGGTVDTIWVPARGAFDLTGEFTIAAWIRADFPSHAFASIIDKGYAEEAYSLGVPGLVEPGTTAITLKVADEEAWAADAVPMGTGEWVHVACTFDDSTDTAEFFANGASLGSSALEAELGVTGYDLRVGSSQWGDPFSGGLDQVAVFDRVLTPAEIVELYEFD
jgi:hypothetical protein